MGYATIQPARQRPMGSLLTRRWFSSDDSHAVYAVKAAALANYINWNTIAHDSFAKTEALGFDVPEHDDAAAALRAWDRQVALAAGLLQDADGKLTDDNTPSSLPPLSGGGFTLIDWRRTWFMDLDGMDRLLPALEQANVDFNNANTRYMRAVETAKTGKQYDQAPQPQTPVDWSRANVPSAAKEALQQLQHRMSLFGDFSLSSIVIAGVVIGGLWLWTWLPKGRRARR